jgi:hypothetical protein
VARVEVGRVARLQIQQSSLKVGPVGLRRYDPAPLRAVDTLLLTRDGATAILPGGGEQLDVHNVRHPETKNVNGLNDVSIGFTSHYTRMRRRLGGALPEGSAGENILVNASRVLTLADVAGGITIEGSDGRHVELGGVRVAHPCVEFSRFALGDHDAAPPAVSEALQFLDAGMRGFYAAVDAGEPQVVKLGDRVFVERY